MTKSRIHQIRIKSLTLKSNQKATALLHTFKIIAMCLKKKKYVKRKAHPSHYLISTGSLSINSNACRKLYYSIRTKCRWSITSSGFRENCYIEQTKTSTQVKRVRCERWLCVLIHTYIYNPWHWPAIKHKKTVENIFQWMQLVTWRKKLTLIFFSIFGEL